MFSRRTSWPTAPNRLAERLAAFGRRRAPLIDLTESNPTRCRFRYDEEAIAAALGNRSVRRYEPVPAGAPAARRAVASYYKELGRPISIERIFLTSSSSEAYSHCFRLLADAGDEILTPAPSYPLLDYLGDLAALRLSKYPLRYEPGGWRIDLEGLEKLISPRTRAIVVVSPNNPTGSLVNGDERDALVQLAARRGLALIADEVFLDYIWSEGRPRETFTGEGRCLTFTLSGLSKISALPQMKLSWIVVRGPEDWAAPAAARLDVIADTYLSVSAPVQAAAPVLLEQRRLLGPQIRARVGRNLAFLDSMLARGSALTRLAAEAGWYAVVRAPATCSDEDWAIRLLDGAGVLVHPGRLFDFDQESCLVLSLIPPEEAFRQGVERLIETIE